MVTLDNLVVTNALVSIREDLGASIEQLEWTVNAYTLSFAVFLLTAAALGDRLGRRRMFAVGIGVFTRRLGGGRARSEHRRADRRARAPGPRRGDRSRRSRLTLLSEAFPAEKRGAGDRHLGRGVGLGVALGPVVGGAVVEGLSWQWIFWLNVPIGLLLAPIAARALRESVGPNARLDLPGVALASVGLLGLVFGIVRGQPLGWTSTTVLGSLAVGVVALAAFVAWELRSPAPMLPMRFFRNRAFAATNAASLAMFFGVVRVDLPAGAVLPDGPGLLAAGGGHPDAAVDGDADGGRADRGHAGRPHRQPAADGRAGWRCSRRRWRGSRSSASRRWPTGCWCRAS